MFQAYTPVYQPHNTLRLITGMYAGLVMITIVLPVFNATVWAAPLDAAPVSRVRDILALWAAAALVIALVLLKLPALLLVAGLVSVGGVLLMFVILGTVAFVTVTIKPGDAGEQVGSALAAIELAQEVHLVAGEDAYLVKLRAADPQELGRIIQHRIIKIDGVQSTRTVIAMETVKETARIPIGQKRVKD